MKYQSIPSGGLMSKIYQGVLFYFSTSMKNDKLNLAKIIKHLYE